MMERFGVDEVYGMHNWPGLPAGHFAIRPGPLLAAADRFTIEIEGQERPACVAETMAIVYGT
jgi:hippurate hydrolase